MAVSSLHVLLVVAAASVPLAGAGCSSGSSSGGTGPAVPVIAMAATASGDGQTAQTGVTLPNPLRVVVTLSGNPQSGKTVSWAAQGTGASVNPLTSVTDASGIATTSWTLGSTVGSQTATATLAGATGSPVSFSATATAPVLVIQKTATASGDAQTGVVATALANPLRVLVTLSGAALAGDTVTWAAVGTGASVSPPKSVTDASGIATTSWTLSQTAGSQSATATLAGATGSPVTFSATGAPGAASQISQVSGDGQSAVIGVAFANPLVVKISDQFGNGVGGDTVAWVSIKGRTSLVPAKSVSGASGLTQASLTAGGTAGADTITATSTGLTGSPVRFGATVAPVPTTASVTVGPGVQFKSVRNGTFNPAVDTVAVNGTVTWTWASGSVSHGVQSTGSPSFTNSSIQSSGSYAFTFTSAGTYTYQCLVHGSSMTGQIVVR
jgi:plastocyanin